VTAVADLLSNVDFGVTFGALLFPGLLLAPGFRRRFFLGGFLCCQLLFPHRIGVILSTLWMRAGSRVGSFSAHGTQVVARASHAGNGFSFAHEFGSNSNCHFAGQLPGDDGWQTCMSATNPGIGWQPD
jgi:hypothetical protein